MAKLFDDDFEGFEPAKSNASQHSEKPQESRKKSAKMRLPGGSYNIDPNSLIPQRLEMTMPISGRTVDFSYFEVPVEKVQIWEQNPRAQRFLTPDNPRIQNIKQSMADAGGQRQPVLARKTASDTIEVVDGMSRWYSAKLIDEERKSHGESGFNLRCWVGDFDDKDAFQLAVRENRERGELSFYEEALYLKKRKDTGYRVEDAAAELGLSRAIGFDRVKLADIPEDIVARLISPNLLQVKPALRILKALEPLTGGPQLTSIIEQLPFGYQDSAKLAQDIFRLLEADQILDTKQGRFFQSDDKRVRVKISNNVKGEHSCSFKGLNEKELNRVLKLVNSLKLQEI